MPISDATRDSELLVRSHATPAHDRRAQVPVRPDGFRWTADKALTLVRTTSHGQRHVCTRCGGVLSIVYDSQPDCIWPVAGAIDDASLPEDVGGSLCRAIHICTSMMPPWYELPDDGLPRLKYAG